MGAFENYKAHSKFMDESTPLIHKPHGARHMEQGTIIEQCEEFTGNFASEQRSERSGFMI